jgi:hypothetical protein
VIQPPFDSAQGLYVELHHRTGLFVTVELAGE